MHMVYKDEKFFNQGCDPSYGRKWHWGIRKGSGRNFDFLFLLAKLTVHQYIYDDQGGGKLP